jgi:D-psicose/D-tagatose/L-ribulose 3-epimerase
MRVAVSNIAWEPVDDSKIAERLLAVGVTGLEVAPTKVWPDLTQVSLRQAEAYGERWAREGLPVVAAQSLLFRRPDLSLFGETREQFVDYLGRVIELCAAMGAVSMVFGSPRNRRRGHLAPDEADRIAKDVFERLAGRAHAVGACLCLEANPVEYDADYLTRAVEAAAVVRAVDAPGLRLHLDSACMSLAGDDAPACVRAFAPLLRHAHLSEPHLGPVGAPNDKHIGFAAALRAVRYDHFVSVEMRPDAGEAIAAVERAARYAVETFGDQE